MERSVVEGSGLRWREAVADEGEQSQVQKSDLRWRGAVSGGGERSLVEGAVSVEGSYRWWMRVV